MYNFWNFLHEVLKKDLRDTFWRKEDRPALWKQKRPWKRGLFILCYRIGTREMQSITWDILVLKAAWVLSLKPPFQRPGLSPSSGLWYQTVITDITVTERSFNLYFFVCVLRLTDIICAFYFIICTLETECLHWVFRASTWETTFVTALPSIWVNTRTFTLWYYSCAVQIFYKLRHRAGAVFTPALVSMLSSIGVRSNEPSLLSVLRHLSLKAWIDCL
jgi:hypothetical protein